MLNLRANYCVFIGAGKVTRGSPRPEVSQIGSQAKGQRNKYITQECSILDEAAEHPQESFCGLRALAEINQKRLNPLEMELYAELLSLR